MRAYRERQLAGTGIEPLFPAWGTPADTSALARAVLADGFRATLTCVDPRHRPPAFAGRDFDAALLADLPPAPTRAANTAGSTRSATPIRWSRAARRASPGPSAAGCPSTRGADIDAERGRPAAAAFR
ncbi:hypothetical protein J0H58_32875 [bacterium]|nr:hypothetical protein [bacterium]